MGRATELLAQMPAPATKESVEGEIERLDFRPDNIDAETWALIQENGKLATERLNQILNSPKFVRLRASDQAKLIALAQNRAYGLPVTNRADQHKRRGAATDVTASELRDMAQRAKLPEYRRYNEQPNEVDDAEEL